MNNSDYDAHSLSAGFEQAARALAWMATCEAVPAKNRLRFDWFARRLTAEVLTQMLAERKKSIGSGEDGDSLSPYHRILLDAYPGRDYLGVDSEDIDAIRIAVACGSVDDSLFTFLWRNFEGRSLNDGGKDALTGLCMALHDIIEVTVAVIDAYRPADTDSEESLP